jgi:hypothetical protein
MKKCKNKKDIQDSILSTSHFFQLYISVIFIFLKSVIFKVKWHTSLDQRE